MSRKKWKKNLEHKQKILRLLKEKKDVEGLIFILEDEDEDVNIRYDAAKALGELKDTRAIDPLIKALDLRTENRVRPAFAYYPIYTSAAVKALGEIGDPRAVDPLLDILISHPGELDDDPIIEETFNALTKMNWNKEGLRLFISLIPALDCMIGLYYGLDYVKKILSAIKITPEITSMLIEILNEETEIHSIVTEVLDLRDPKVAECLINALIENRIKLDKHAVCIFGEIGDPRAIEPLIDVLVENRIYVEDFDDDEDYTSYIETISDAFRSMGDVENIIQKLINRIKSKELEEDHKEMIEDIVVSLRSKMQ